MTTTQSTPLTTSDWIILAQAVVMALTLLVLVWQIRVLISTARTSQYQAALQMLFDWRSDIIRDEELADRYRTSSYFQKVFSEQPPKQYFHTLKLFHTLEVLFLLRQHGIINQDMGVVWQKQAEVLFTPEANRTLWRRLKGISIYNAEFTKSVDAVVATIDERDAHSTVRHQ